ncbi:hypothetical protein [Kribbella steppae]|uniref:hypothetical protein n=1 Tax=Kribbella steppae TaxID=2512223 RepID=UPI001053EBCC|nr:hypothetical protein [Kribbella steppae]
MSPTAALHREGDGPEYRNGLVLGALHFAKSWNLALDTPRQRAGIHDSAAAEQTGRQYAANRMRSFEVNEPG